MRRLAAAILAVPVIASIYVAALVAVPGFRRNLAIVGAVLLVGVVGLGQALLPAAAPVPPSAPSTLSSNSVQPTETSSGAVAASDSQGSEPAPTALSRPNRATIGSGARQRAPVTAPLPGARPAATPIARPGLLPPAPAVRAPTTATVTPSLRIGNRVLLTTSIALRFDRGVSATQVRASFAITPSVKGTIHATTNRLYTFTPLGPLAPDTVYTVHFRNTIRDTDGVVVSAPESVRLLTAAAPGLVRFRPTQGTTAVDPTSLVSVRFTTSMNRRTTARAFAVVIAGRRIPGRVTWAENDTVLVFRPANGLTPGSGVGVRVLGTATSADGVRIGKGVSSTFTVAAAGTPAPTAAKPVAKPVTRPRGANGTAPPSGGGPPGGGRTTSPGDGIVEGIDVSHHDGTIDWQQVAASGKSFAYMKATEGTEFVDPSYAANRASALAAGLVVGAFHYAQPDSSPGSAAAQADHFVDIAAFRSGELLPMLDLEVTNGLSVTELQAWVRAFLDRVYQRTGLRAGVYVSPNFWKTYAGDTASIALGGYSVLWLAHWTSAASPSPPGANWGGYGWTIWQYSDKSAVAGIARPADVDRCDGTDFAKLLIR